MFKATFNNHYIVLVFYIAHQLWPIKNVISFEETGLDYLTWYTSFINMLMVVSLVVIKHNKDIPYNNSINKVVCGSGIFPFHETKRAVVNCEATLFLGSLHHSLSFDTWKPSFLKSLAWLSRLLAMGFGSGSLSNAIFRKFRISFTVPWERKKTLWSTYE